VCGCMANDLLHAPSLENLPVPGGAESPGLTTIPISTPHPIGYRKMIIGTDNASSNRLYYFVISVSVLNT